jgi:hypothetical protein
VSTSQTQFLSEILDGETIPDGAFVYFRGDLENQAHSLLLKVYHKRHSEEGLSQKEYAARIRHTAEVVNRHIAVAGNWQLDTIADYFLGLRARLLLSIVFLEDLRSDSTVQPVLRSGQSLQSYAAAGVDNTALGRSNRERLLENLANPGFSTALNTSPASPAAGANPRSLQLIVSQPDRGRGKLRRIPEVEPTSADSENLTRIVGAR